MSNNTPVMIEFYTNWIPSIRRVMVVRYRTAKYWEACGHNIVIYPVDPALLRSADLIALSHAE